MSSCGCSAREADGEGFRLDEDVPIGGEALVELTRRVARSEDHAIGVDGAAVVQLHACDEPVLHDDVFDARLEPHLDAHGDELVAHLLDGEGQQIGADVRLALHETRSGAPYFAKVSITRRTCGWLMRVDSFPSVYAPALPSPKFMFDSGNSVPSRESFATSFLR